MKAKKPYKINTLTAISTPTTGTLLNLDEKLR